MPIGIIVTAKVEGLDIFSKYIEKYGEDAVAGMSMAMYQEAEKIITSAKQLTPVNTGALHDSGLAQFPDHEGTALKQELGFGGVAAPYAIYVHEDMTANHVVGQAKFLEIPFREAQVGLAERLIRTMRGYLARNGYGTS